MRRPFPYPLTAEVAARLVAVLTRHGGSCTLRDLHRRHRFWDSGILEQTAAAGIIRIEKRQPLTGRPSLVAVLNSAGVNNSPSAKLPRRRDVPRGLSCREQLFLAHYWCKRGTGFFGGGRNAGCAADAYRKVYGKFRRLTAASARSAGARLMRRPWMRAAFLLDRRLMNHGGRLHWPVDLHSKGREWLQLLRSLDRQYLDWPADIGQIIRLAQTYEGALDHLALANSS